jgi:hypothetical protein
VSHPSLGLPPLDETAGFPAAARRLRAARDRLGVRALEVAIERNPAIRERHSEYALRQILRDTRIFIDRIALCVSSGDPSPARDFADQIVPVYRRRRMSMDDLIATFEGLRAASAAILTGPEAEAMESAIDESIAVFKWHRRIAGDRKRNRLLQLIYKGA